MKKNIGGGMPFSDLGQTRVYQLLSDIHHLSAETYPVGFMDLLGVHQDITRYALTHTPPMEFPAIPKYSSSSEAVTGEEKKSNDEEHAEEEENGEEQRHKRNKLFESTKSSDQTKMRVPKVTFITKSEVDQLDDGYKWRKYGQKPIKNSPFPRNYYRCTTYWCDVKKRVERSFSDPSTVITTYIGQHTHPPRPVLIMPKRGRFRSNGSASRVHFGLPTVHPPQLQQPFDHNNHQQRQGLSVSGTKYITRQAAGKGFDHVNDQVVRKSRTDRDLLDEAGIVKDRGLLQDVVSSHIIKKEY